MQKRKKERSSGKNRLFEKEQSSKKKLRHRWFNKGEFVGFDIQSIIMTVLTMLTAVTTVVMGLLLYNRFQMAINQTAISNAEGIVETTVDKVNSSLLDIRQISNAANYNIIQEYDISDQNFNRQFSLLYEINTDKIQSMALYSSDGRLITAEPVSAEKKGVFVGEQDWFQDAMGDIENLHFSMPHVQNLLEDGSNRYHWVISLSQSVDINDGDSPMGGVLLVDMKYSVISETFDRINQAAGGTCYYLCDKDGRLLYHPRQTEIDRGLYTENSQEAAAYDDGTYEISSDGKKENIVVGSVSYTGWKLVAVVPDGAQTTNIKKFGYYIIATVMILLMMLLFVNRLVSKRISNPILKLNDSVKAYEAGGESNIFIGGSSEIRHLGYSVQKSYEQIETLMKEIIRQQNERRKSELDALQSQINPHFLYNTLESITWMVEAGKNTDAVFMISELAKLLRISLSKGRTIISIEDELQHSQSYMNIQLARYKERFKVEYDIDEEIKSYCTVKLIIQPILENAIYYGVGNMDEDDGGMITISGKMKDGDIYISVEDNGMGMPEDVAANILTDNSKVPKHGSGVGVINVHSRIKLMFGDAYGLEVYSEPDEGTKVVIHIPAIPYNEENRLALETQKYGKEKGTDEEK